MKKISTGLFIIGLICCSLQSVFAEKSSLLWKISGNGLSRPSYLFAALSPICKEDYFWTDTMQQCFLKAEQLCVESDMKDSLALDKITYAMRITSTVPLKNYLKPGEYEEVDAYFQKKFGYPVMDLKPVWLSMMLVKNTYSCDSVVYYEARLTDAAIQYHKPIEVFETVHMQMFMIDKYIKDEQGVPELLNIVRGNKTENKADLSRKTAFYHAQNIDSLYTMGLRPDRKEWIELDQQRKYAWCIRIHQLAPQQSTFFVVRPEMLSGKFGLIALLRKLGYTVSAIK